METGVSVHFKTIHNKEPRNLCTMKCRLGGSLLENSHLENREGYEYVSRSCPMAGVGIRDGGLPQCHLRILLCYEF
jgi:hypothetical protein